jgi:hypothetical protein
MVNKIYTAVNSQKTRFAKYIEIVSKRRDFSLGFYPLKLQRWVQLSLVQYLLEVILIALEGVREVLGFVRSETI